MKPTRQRILDYLENHQSASAVELSHTLLVTSADIRHHLYLLVKAKIVGKIAVKHSSGAGRPSILYAKVKKGADEQLIPLTHILLDILFEKTIDGLNPTVLEQVANHLVGESNLSDNKGSYSLINKILRTIPRLNTLGYHARWEAHSVSPRIIFGHCPYEAILPYHPILCQIDVLMLEKMVKKQIKPLISIKPDLQESHACIFIVEV
jgi:predicted ArsR family transcriptional regulator